ncbi:hypothetical protein [Nostoc linckia]|nr:hypothetical protein [Nostoc linckia]
MGRWGDGEMGRWGDGEMSFSPGASSAPCPILRLRSVQVPHAQ